MGRPRATLRQAILGASAAVVLALTIVVVTALRPAKEPTTQPAPPIATTAEPTGSSTTAPPATPSTRSSVARVWPAEPVEIVGNQVRTAGHRWSVGGPGDVVAVGDWDCDGTVTPAVLRASTGRLHLFAVWAAQEETVTAVSGPTVPADAIGVEARGCGTASVRTADGRTLDVSTSDSGR